MNWNPEVSAYIDTAPSEQFEILSQLRKLIHESVPGTQEAVKWGMPVFSLAKNYAYLRCNKKHITLGFYNKHVLSDPDGLLEGEGKDLAHIKIVSKSDIHRSQLRDWFRSAARATQ